MIRHLAFLAPVALLGLAACGDQAALTQAKEGDCFTVVGHEANGRPKLEKSECLTGLQAEAPILPPAADVPGTEVAQASPATAAPNCPTMPLVCPGISAPAPERRAAASQAGAARATRTQGRTQARAQARSQTRNQQARASSRSRSDRTVELGQYERVYTPDYPQSELLGPPPPPAPYAYRPAPDLPPPPPVDRYRQRDDAYAYGRREHYGDRYALAPPPSPPPLPHPPAPGYSGSYRERSEGGSSYSRRESYSSSSRSSSSHGFTQGHGYGYGCPRDCPRPDSGNMAPMNGPHYPVDADGYLTWRGKTR